MSKIELVNCDICGNGCGEMTQKTQVIFTTEQTEGRSCNPYLQLVDIDLCDECKEHLLKGNYIFAEGAQGYNKYYFNAPHRVK